MINSLFLIPAVIVITGALILPILPRSIRSSTFLLFPLVALVVIWYFPEGTEWTIPYADYTLIPFSVDALSRIFATIFALILAVGGLYALHVDELGQQTSALVYGGGAVGVAMAGDFLSLLIFWELMAVSSTYLIWARRTNASDRAGLRYLMVHVLGGGVLLSGILWYISRSGSLEITSLTEAFPSIPSALILLGVSINTAIPPLHAWLADAYPRATVTGAVFLSAFTTKSAVYVLVRVFPGLPLLIWFGVAMALYGVVYAVLANDIRKILAYHIISQVGYMVTGVGIGTEMALNGTVAHAFSHILYKSLLFMGAGAVLHATGRSKLTELGGIASRMKITVTLYMIGAFSISGFPLFNGFISKSMVVSAAGDAHLNTVNLLLIMASVGTFLHTGLKLPYFTWFGSSEEQIEVDSVPTNMILGMGTAAFFCTLFGVYPDLLYRHLPHAVDYHPYTLYHLVEITQVMVLTFVGFWILRKKLEGEPKIALDVDWFYRKPAPLVRLVFVDFVDDFFGSVDRRVMKLASRTAAAFENPLRWLNPAAGENRHAADYSPPIGTLTLSFLIALVVVGIILLI